jgi:hypothetical protein
MHGIQCGGGAMQKKALYNSTHAHCMPAHRNKSSTLSYVAKASRPSGKGAHCLGEKMVRCNGKERAATASKRSGGGGRANTLSQITTHEKVRSVKQASHFCACPLLYIVGCTQTHYSYIHNP